MRPSPVMLRSHIWVAVIAALPATACVESRSFTCGTAVCGFNNVCSPSGDRCVAPQRVDSCRNGVDGDACSYPGVDNGSCAAGVCEPVGCGNGVVEPQLGEVCDDGNRLDGDDCSAQCTSMLRCGDGVVDYALGEQCDCGEPGMMVAGCNGANSDAPDATCRAMLGTRSCQLARCGDAIIDANEMCDDGNVVSGDGCRSDCEGRWSVMQTNAFGQLEAVWGRNGSDVFAVGNGVILHYDGHAWTPMVVPTPALYYRDVWGAGGQVFAVGGRNSATAARVDRLNGTSWEPYSTAPLGTFLLGISGRSASDFWVVGHASGTPVIQHFVDGNTTPTAATCNGLSNPVARVWIDPASGIGVLGALSNPEAICRYDGSTWSVVPDVNASLPWGTSANDIYVAGEDPSAIVSHSSNGTSWTPMTETNVIERAFGIGGSAGDAIVVGEAGRMMVNNGSGWKVSPSPVSASFRGVWGYAPDHAFVVGWNGVILY